MLRTCSACRSSRFTATALKNEPCSVWQYGGKLKTESFYSCTGTFTHRCTWLHLVSLQVHFACRASGSNATRTREVGKEVETPQARLKEQCYQELVQLAKTIGNDTLPHSADHAT